MAKGLRSKYARRVRATRRAHYWEVEGKSKLEELSRNLHNPTYDMKQDVALPSNAYIEPENPNAVFPQHAKPHIIDFRDWKMAQSGFASRFNFRKNMSNRATRKTKYETTLRSNEEIEADRIAKEMMEAEINGKEDGEDMSEDEIDIN